MGEGGLTSSCGRDDYVVAVPQRRTALTRPATTGRDAQVLAAKGEPMACKEIVETMLAKGMWTTGGKTPAATIYSAMLREIDGKPGESRFVKTGRGLFALTTTPTPDSPNAGGDAAPSDGNPTV